MLLTKAGKVIAWWFLGNTFNLVFATGFTVQVRRSVDVSNRRGKEYHYL